MIKKICLICQKEFETYSLKAKFCSGACRGNSQSKKREDISNKLVTLWSEDKTYKEMADEFKVSIRTISKWLRKFDLDLKFRFKGMKNKRWEGYGGISKNIWERINRRARKKDIEITIDIKDAWQQYLKQKGRCAISGVSINLNCDELSNHEIDKGALSASLDRIDSSKGYIEGNIQWIHKYIQTMKMDNSDEYCIDWCHTISDFQRSKQDAGVYLL